MRHRIGLTYEAEAEEITQDDIVTEIAPTLMVLNSSDLDAITLLQQVRRIEIQTWIKRSALFRRISSSFKGRGMSFAEVRPYQSGDDVRSIDWNHAENVHPH